MGLTDTQEHGHMPTLKTAMGERVRKKRRLVRGHMHGPWMCPLLTCRNSLGRLQ